MASGTVMKQVSDELFMLKRQYEDSQIGVVRRGPEADRFISKFSYEYVDSFPNDDLSLLDEIRRQLRREKAVFIVACGDEQEYQLYARDW